MNQEQIDEIALKCYMEIGDGKEWAIGGIGDVKEFARRLVAEIQARNEPVAWLDVELGMADVQKAFDTDLPLYTSPPDYEVLRKDAELYRKGLTAIEQLISESYGVAGLHRNGDVAPWDELRTGGRFEDWLLDFDNAIAKEKTK